MSVFFGTSGIRADNSFFSDQFCFDIGRTFSIFLRNNNSLGNVAIGRDPRISGPKILNFVSSGVIYEDRKVVSMSVCPIPALNYLLVKDKSFAGSIMVTGSHIKETMNGLKFFAFKEEISKDNEREIEEIFNKIKDSIPYKDFSSKILLSNDAQKYYSQLLFNLADKPFPKWKLAVDPGNGAQAEFIDKLLLSLNLDLIVLNNSKEKGFISRDTEEDGAFKGLQEAVIKNKADLGIAFDADGDRVVFIDEKGEYVPGDYSCSLVARESPSKTIVTPVGSSQVVDSIGKKVIRTKVGSPYVVEAMKRNKALFGFEANGGGISSEIMFSRDGGSTMVKILNLYKRHRRTFFSLVSTLPKFSIFRTKVDCPSKMNNLILEKAEKSFKGVRTEKLDGLKIWLDNSSWILFRPSSNAPEFRVFTEAKTREKAKELGKKGIEFVKNIVNNEKEQND